MAKRGPKPVAPDDLYKTASGFYREFRGLAGLLEHWSFDRDRNEALKRLTRELIHYDRIKFEQKEEMIRTGRVTTAAGEQELQQLEQELQQLKKDIEYAKRERTLNFAYDASRKATKGGADPEVVHALLAATIPERIREICETHLGSEMAKVFNQGTMTARSHFYETLRQHAGRFIAAKNHVKFPSGRPRKSTLLEQFWFLSRAIAAAAHDRGINTVLNLGLKRPDQGLVESPAAISKIRKRTAGREDSLGSQKSKGASVA